ncbi:hypothetical protein ACFORG_15365 [Lutimaribacter marinistellae]|uniref:Uncharacterized protein n=1 Tax=Lutimaribacter marinistellae TaxID=1820329 RepID=A0ABV7TLV0_9RHOB
MPDEMTRMTATGQMRELTIETLHRMVRQDLYEAVNLGLLTKDEACDEAIKTALDWKSKTPEGGRRE